MATRRTGSRQIVVDGTAYWWRIRHRATYSQIDYGVGKLHVAIERAEGSGALLVLRTDRPHPHDIATVRVIPVRPSDVADWIRRAIAAGWSPATSGPHFFATARGTVVSRDV